MRISGVTRSITVASMIAPLRLPPATTVAPLAFASAISSSMRSAAARLTSEPSTTCAARIAGRQRRARLASFVDEGVGDRLVDDQPLGRHADLALVGEGAEHRGVDRRVEVGVVEHDERRLAAELEQDRLQVLGAQLGDLLADPRGAGEVDALDRRMGDQRRHDLRRVLGRVRDDVDDALRESPPRSGPRRSGDASPGRFPRSAG